MGEQFKNGYALLVGVNDNKVPNWALPEVKKDVRALESVLKHPDRCAYLDENVKAITGTEATRQGILDGLEWLQSRINADTSGNATAVIYYSGHGWRDTQVAPPAYYLVPYDMRADRIRSRALKIEDFAEEVGAVTPERLLVIFDCCHAGGMGVKDLEDAVATGYSKAAVETRMWTVNEGASPSAGTKSLEELAQGHGRAVLSSSQGKEVSFLRKDGKMSIFTYHLIEALTGHAQPQEGATEVLVSDVMGHVYRTVRESALRDHGQGQNPDYQVSGNFPVAMLLGGAGWSKDLTAPDPLDEPAAPRPEKPRRVINTGGGAFIGGSVSTGGGDFVGRDQVVHGDQVRGDQVAGDQISVGEISGGTGFTIGRGGQVEVSQGLGGDEIAAVFKALRQEVSRLPESPNKVMAQTAVDNLEAEGKKGTGANESNVEDWLKFLAQNVPDFFEVAVNTFINPVQGLSTVFQKIAQRMRG